MPVLGAALLLLTLPKGWTARAEGALGWVVRTLGVLRDRLGDQD
ncbi:MAG: hypothetical protein AAGF75_04145 [Cyanobacteria bacterium P01_H01_bin.130]